VFPFGDIVGQEEAKLALILATVDPGIGGVLLRGHKGAAKTTLARGLADLLGGAPFVELPLGATEDRLMGTLDAAAALAGDGFHFRPGLMAEANDGVLYVDEINLLADHLVDALLDVSVSGENIVERDGVSHRHPARFVLVGSMNPEEGELRPQLLDRFGFCVEMTTPTDITTRVEAIRRRLVFDGHRLNGPVREAVGTSIGIEAMTSSLPSARSATMASTILEAASRLAVEVGAEGLRADLTLCRAAAALAGVEGRADTELADLRRVAPLVLAHRTRRTPFDPPVMDPDDIDRAISEALDGLSADEPPTGSAEAEHSGGHDPAHGDDDGHEVGERRRVDDGEDGQGSRRPDPGVGIGVGGRPLTIGGPRRAPSPESPEGLQVVGRGRFVRDVSAGDGHVVSVPATVRALAHRRALDPAAVLGPDDLRSEERIAPGHRTIVVCVDLSGSMGADERAKAATGMVLGLLADAYQRRDRVALVGFRAGEAQVLLSPTSSVEVARNRLEGLVTGGDTPLAMGIARGLGVAEAASADGSETLLILLTDGRATGGTAAVDAAMVAAADVRRRGIPSMVLDCESGPIRLGMAERLAEAMGARHVPVASVDSVTLTDTIGAISSSRP
jgi:magnesium chelatase subunit D